MTDADFGTELNINVETESALWELIRTKALRVPNSYYRHIVGRQVSISWSAQVVQTSIVLLIACGLLWAVRPRIGLSSDGTVT